MPTRRRRNPRKPATSNEIVAAINATDVSGVLSHADATNLWNTCWLGEYTVPEVEQAAQRLILARKRAGRDFDTRVPGPGTGRRRRRRNPATLYDPTMQTRMRRAAVEHYDERDTLETLPAIGYGPASRSGVQVVRTRVIPTGGTRRGKPAYVIGSRRNPSSSVGSLVSASHLRPGDTIELEDLGRTHVIRGPFRSGRGVRFENQYGNSLMLMPGERVRLVARENPRRRARRRRRRS